MKKSVNISILSVHSYFQTDIILENLEHAEITNIISAQQKKWPMWHGAKALLAQSRYQKMNRKHKKGTFWLMIPDVMFFRGAKNNCLFFRLQKGGNNQNSMIWPFWWYSKKDEVNSIHLMVIMHFLSYGSQHQFFIHFDREWTGRHVPFFIQSYFCVNYTYYFKWPPNQHLPPHISIEKISLFISPFFVSLSWKAFMPL